MLLVTAGSLNPKVYIKNRKTSKLHKRLPELLILYIDKLRYTIMYTHQ